jgi:hypothetical protein
MWMGGTVPLGYDVKDRKLLVNKAEARTVVDIYRRYLRSNRFARSGKSSTLPASGVSAAYGPTARNTGTSGSHKGRFIFCFRTDLLWGSNSQRQCLSGRAFGNRRQTVWDAVQAVLAENRVVRASGSTPGSQAC